MPSCSTRSRGSGAQCARLRAVGPGVQGRRRSCLGDCGTCGPRPAEHRLHPLPRYAGGDAGGGDTPCRAAAAQAQARRTRRPGPCRGGTRRRARGAHHRRRERGLDCLGLPDPGAGARPSRSVDDRAAPSRRRRRRRSRAWNVLSRSARTRPATTARPWTRSPGATTSSTSSSTRRAGSPRRSRFAMPRGRGASTSWWAA